jgi:protein-tyrosine-phosphatase
VQLSPLDVAHRAALHAALGEPLRLAIVDDLAVSDRSPSELGERHGLTANLLAHHLDVLEAAGAIIRFESSGDRRRRYVRLVTDSLEWLLVGSQPPQRPALFVCTDNAARSQLAAALWTERTGLPAESMGTHPAPWVHPATIEAATRAGLDLGAVAPRRIERLRLVDRNVQIITVCDRAREELGWNDQWWHWSTPDPLETGTDEAFDAVIADLDERLSELAASPFG